MASVFNGAASVIFDSFKLALLKGEINFAADFVKPALIGWIKCYGPGTAYSWHKEPNVCGQGLLIYASPEVVTGTELECPICGSFSPVKLRVT